MLKERLRQILIEQAQTGNPTTYRELASGLGLEPPNTIHRIAEVLESLMQDDVGAGRPILQARAFHARELQRVFSFYKTSRRN